MSLNTKERLLLKFTSGRFLITVILTIAFCVLAVLGKLTSEFINIYMILVTFYFSKDRLSYTSGTTTITQEENTPVVNTTSTTTSTDGPETI